MKKSFLLLLIALALFLSGCAGASSGPTQAVEKYYKAIQAQDAEQLKQVTCPAFQETAQTELDSFAGVKTELQGLSCKETGKEGASTLVTCDGKIVATYGSEKMDFPLNQRVHKVQDQGGTWKVCEY